MQKKRAEDPKLFKIRAILRINPDAPLRYDHSITTKDDYVELLHIALDAGLIKIVVEEDGSLALYSIPSAL
jgi:hypothetical protein